MRKQKYISFKLLYFVFSFINLLSNQIKSLSNIYIKGETPFLNASYCKSNNNILKKESFLPQTICCVTCILMVINNKTVTFWKQLRSQCLPPDCSDSAAGIIIAGLPATVNCDPLWTQVIQSPLTFLQQPTIHFLFIRCTVRAEKDNMRPKKRTPR